MSSPLTLKLLPSEEERINDWLIEKIKEFNNNDFDTIEQSPKKKLFKIKQTKNDFRKSKRTI